VGGRNEREIMTRNELNGYLCAVLETLGEVAPYTAHEGPMYAAMMGKVSLEEFQTVLTVAAKGGLVERANHVVALTSKGLEMVRKIQAHRAA